MNAEYRHAYNLLYDNYLKRRWLNKTVETAATDAHKLTKRIFEEVIGGVMQRRELKLREDARYLLLLLFVEMIITPILLNRNRNVTVKHLEEIITNDLTRLLRDACPNDKREITGNRIVDTISKLEYSLTLNALKIWG